tara:strand:+ start:427 stop:528 length:102 start_codon:yes stop_codon:yes gene_type:complete
MGRALQALFPFYIYVFTMGLLLGINSPKYPYCD